MLISSEQIGEITPEKCEYEIVENLISLLNNIAINYSPL